MPGYSIIEQIFNFLNELVKSLANGYLFSEVFGMLFVPLVISYLLQSLFIGFFCLLDNQELGSLLKA